MPLVRLESRNDFAEWRAAARALLMSGTPPEAVVWADPDSRGDLFADPAPRPAVTARTVGTVPPRFIELAEAAICHSDPERFALLYRLLYRLQKARDLLAVRSDPDVEKLHRRADAVRRDAHKMKAFVRFKSIVDDSGLERFAAWFEPEHFILERTAPFFVRRFTGMMWAVVTPYRSAYWDGEELIFGDGGTRADVPAEDALESAWRTYFSSIFNPARLKVAMMKSEMPVKYWGSLPEATLIPSLIRSAKDRELEMLRREASQPSSRHVRQVEREPLEKSQATEISSIADARSQVEGCRRCPLYEMATQAVFGEGPAHADVMFVGEQPGDQEDLTGKPFVGPAGKVFDAAMEKIGFDRRRTYVTNAVKHFKFIPRGKRRLHQKPNAGEIAACRFWLNLEREFVRPKVIVALGATAVQSITGKSASIASLRGRRHELDDGTHLFVTVHPSYLLRIQADGNTDIEAERRRFEADLLQILTFAEGLEAPATRKAS
jgi:uracil-DNA glycosylase